MSSTALRYAIALDVRVERVHQVENSRARWCSPALVSAIALPSGSDGG